MIDDDGAVRTRQVIPLLLFVAICLVFASFVLIDRLEFESCNLMDGDREDSARIFWRWR